MLMILLHQDPFSKYIFEKKDVLFNVLVIYRFQESQHVNFPWKEMYLSFLGIIKKVYNSMERKFFTIQGILYVVEIWHINIKVLKAMSFPVVGPHVFQLHGMVNMARLGIKFNYI